MAVGTNTGIGGLGLTGLDTSTTAAAEASAMNTYGITPAEAQSIGVSAPLNPDAAGNSSNSMKEAASEKAVSDACGKGCCPGDIQPQCSKYQSELNASCQKAMAPYTDKCSSCGGSGMSNGGDSGGGGGGGSDDSGGSGITYEASPYTFKYRYETDIIDFSAYMIVRSSVYGDSSSSAIVGYSNSDEGYPHTDTNPQRAVYGDPLDPTIEPWLSVESPSFVFTAHVFSANGLVRFNNTLMPSVTKVFISELDLTSDDIAPVLDVLKTGDLMLFTKYEDDGVFVSLRFISQTDKGNKREINVEYVSHNGAVAKDDVFVFDTSRNIIKIPEGATAVVACPHCGGSGLEGCDGLEGVILAVYNGAAALAGVTNVDIYGIVQPS